MYTQANIDCVQAQYKKRALLWLIPEVLLMGLIVASLVMRIEWLTSLLFALLCALILFSVSMSLQPVKNYRRFLQNAVHGRNRTDKLTFESMGEEIVAREGAWFYPVTMRAESLKEELEERSFYWDANLPRPNWEKGQVLTVKSHEKMITAWEFA